MSPRWQLRIAHGLMIAGALPFTLALGWTIAFFVTFVPGELPRVPILDPIAMVGVLLTSYAIAFVLGVPSAIWSWALTYRNAEIRSAFSKCVRIFIALVLIAPIVLNMITGVAASFA